jgi:hypothetical protein
MLGRSVSLLGSTPSYRAACRRLHRISSIRLSHKPLAPAHPGRSRNCSTARSQNGEAAEPQQQAPKPEHKADVAESSSSSPPKHQHQEQHGHGGHHDGTHGAAHQLQHRAAEKMTFQLLEKVRSLPNSGVESLYQTYVGQATEGYGRAQQSLSRIRKHTSAQQLSSKCRCFRELLWQRRPCQHQLPRDQSRTMFVRQCSTGC